MRKRPGVRMLLVAVAIVALIAALLATVGRAGRNRLIVANRSGMVVKSLEITVGPTAIAFGDLAPDRTIGADFPISGDASFAVSGRLADGTALGGNFGYVTGGMSGERAHFTIEPGGKIGFRQGR